MTDDVLEGLRASVARVKEDPELRCVTDRARQELAPAPTSSGAQRDGGATALLPNERSFAMASPFLLDPADRIPVIGALQGRRSAAASTRAGLRHPRGEPRRATSARTSPLGIHSGMATTYILPRLVGLPRAAELLFAGRIVSGAEAAELGMVNHAVAEADVMPRAQEIAREIAGCAPIAVRWTKRSLYRNYGWDPVSAAEGEAHAQSRTFETEDSKEGVAALLEKRPPVFKGR
jgi:hypothetical protein